LSWKPILVAHEPLTVWLYGTVLGHLTAPRFGRVQFEPSGAALDRWGLGSTILSVSLPLARTRPTNDRSLRFFDGLLPEGLARTQLERRFEIRRGDTFGLLAALGRDSAGALVLLPHGESPDQLGDAIPVSEDDLESLIVGLEERPLGADHAVRVSLAGQQDKLLLTRLADGRWAKPANGYPSTHIFKPEDSRFPGYAANEALCMQLAKAVGLTDVDTDVLDIGGIATIVVERYDRTVELSGRVDRVHQEDMCQALSIDNVVRDRKYQRDGGPSLRDIATLLDRHGHPDDRKRLLEAATFNVAIGNSDAHGRNFSLVHDLHGAARLAPLYDVSSIVQYLTVETSRGPMPINHDAAMSVNGLWNMDRINAADLAKEAATWGMIERQARTVVSDLIERLDVALTAFEVDGSAPIVASLRQRCDALRAP
jgi:serine/threonine-protein kinase HipA